MPDPKPPAPGLFADGPAESAAQQAVEASPWEDDEATEPEPEPEGDDDREPEPESEPEPDEPAPVPPALANYDAVADVTAAFVDTVAHEAAKTPGAPSAREITARVKEVLEDFGVRTREAPASGTAPAPKPDPKPPGTGFEKLWEDIGLFLRSLPRRGGIVNLIRSREFTNQYVQAIYARFVDYRSMLDQSIREMEEAYEWLDRT